MKFDLSNSDGETVIGDAILSNSPKIGDILPFGGANWRVTAIIWLAETNRNDVSSGCVCVKRIESA